MQMVRKKKKFYAPDVTQTIQFLSETILCIFDIFSDTSMQTLKCNILYVDLILNLF